MFNTYEDMTCPKCGTQLQRIMTKELEEDRRGFSTGRYRWVCDHLECPLCNYIEIVDGDYCATEWR